MGWATKRRRVCILSFWHRTLKISENGLELIKHFEGLELEAYRCPGGVWTIGYGHTKTAGPGMKCTEKEAEAMLKYEIEEYEGYINRLNVKLNQEQFDALVSWVYNLGPANLLSSTLLKRLKSGDYWDVPDQIRRWNKSSGSVLAGLVRRREAEACLFQGLDWK